MLPRRRAIDGPVAILSFQSHGDLEVGGKTYRIARLGALEKKGYDIARLPFALRILLENLLRREDGRSVPAADTV